MDLSIYNSSQRNQTNIIPTDKPTSKMCKLPSTLQRDSYKKQSILETLKIPDRLRSLLPLLKFSFIAFRFRIFYIGALYM